MTNIDYDLKFFNEENQSYPDIAAQKECLKEAILESHKNGSISETSMSVLNEFIDDCNYSRQLDINSLMPSYLVSDDFIHIYSTDGKSDPEVCARFIHLLFKCHLFNEMIIKDDFQVLEYFMQPDNAADHNKWFVASAQSIIASANGWAYLPSNSELAKDFITFYPIQRWSYHSTTKAQAA